MILSQTQKERGENYEVHFSCRQQFKAMDTDLQQRIRNVCEVMRPARLNMFGNDDYTDDEQARLINLANQNHVPASLCLIWYTSDHHWDNFQVQWQNLPEPEGIRFQMYFEPVDK
jgi:hypothetical protein